MMHEEPSLVVICGWSPILFGCPDCSVSKKSPASQETLIRFLGQEDPLEKIPTPVFWGFPCGSAGKESACNGADLNLIPGLGRCPGEGKSYPPQLHKHRPHKRSWEELPHARDQGWWQGAAKFRLKLKKVEKTTRLFSYDLNQIAYDYTVEVRNRFKGLDLIDRVLDELWMEVHDIVQETGIKIIPKKKKCKKKNKNGCLQRSYK